MNLSNLQVLFIFTNVSLGEYFNSLNYLMFTLNSNFKALNYLFVIH